MGDLRLGDRVFAVIGLGQMGESTAEAQSRQGRDGGSCGRDFSGQESEAPHAGVNRQVKMKCRTAPDGDFREGAGHLKMRTGQAEVWRQRLLCFVRQGAQQHPDWRGDAGLAQSQGFVKAKHGQSLGAG